jgi:hypothetical protein
MLPICDSQFGVNGMALVRDSLKDSGVESVWTLVAALHGWYLERILTSGSPPPGGKGQRRRRWLLPTDMAIAADRGCRHAKVSWAVSRDLQTLRAYNHQFINSKLHLAN